MTQDTMTSFQRILTTLHHKEPDRVPFFLCLTLHGAREVGLSIREYFSQPQNVVEGQMRMLAKYRHDGVYTFFYAPIEVEAWGGEVIYFEDGPPNSGTPFIQRPDDIRSLEPPEIKDSPCLQKVLKAQEMLKERVAGECPVVGVVMSPFSVPVMQMGFDKYIELMFEQPKLFKQLMRVNEAFCIAWANAQLQAGADMIAYFDPVASPTMVPRDVYLKTGFETAKRTLAAIKGPVAIHMASGRAMGIIQDITETGAVMLGVSMEEDLAELKKAANGKVALLGNLNGIEMRHWTPEKAEATVKESIAKAGRGGGYVLSDNHGEIPWQVPEEVLLTISDSVYKWGRYPLNWV